LLRGPNAFFELFHFRAPAAPRAKWRAPNEAGITHVCVQTRDGDRALDAFGARGVKFSSPMTGLGGEYRYAYGRAGEFMIEVEDAAYAPTTPSAWIGHVAFATPDLARLSAFYAALVARKPEFSPRLHAHPAIDVVTGLNDVDVRAAWVHGLNIGLEFWSYVQPPTRARAQRREIHEHGYSHVCFESDDIEADFAQAISLGAEPHAPPQALGGALAAYLRDPDGNIVELLQWRSANARLAIARTPHQHILKRMEEARAAARENKRAVS
jgi:catechol 2,3-dioxygenase-like lactoylglutathione lyase family enzyme